MSLSPDKSTAGERSSHVAFATLIFRRLKLQTYAFAPPGDLGAFTDAALADAGRHALVERVKRENALIEDKLFRTDPYRKHANLPGALLAARREFLLQRAKIIVAACAFFRTRLPIVIILHQVLLYAHRLLDAAGRDQVANTKPEQLAYVAINEATDYVRKWRRPNRIGLVDHLCAGVQCAVLRLTASDLANDAGWKLFIQYVRERDARLVRFAEALTRFDVFEPGETPAALAREAGVDTSELPALRDRLAKLAQKFRLQYEDWR